MTPAEQAERLADYIKRTVDAAPPLTPEQRDLLAVLLRGGAVQPSDKRPVSREEHDARIGHSLNRRMSSGRD